MKKHMMILRVILILTSFFAGSQLLSATTYKLTQVTTVADGNKYVFVESGHALVSSISNNALQSTTSFNTTGLAGNESYVWTLESATGGYYMKMSNGKYLNNTSSTNMAAENNKSSIWYISFTAGLATFTNTTNQNRFIGDSGGNKYKAYTSEGSSLDIIKHSFTVYQLEEETGSTPTPTETFTVTYHVGDNEFHVERTEGEALGLESPDAIGGMDFAGWSSSSSTSAPVWVSNTTSVTNNMELYAMFTMTVGIDPTYTLVESALSDWRGDYLIASSATTFADGRVGGESGMGNSTTRKNPGDNLSDNGKVVNVTWGDTYHVTLEAVNDANLALGYLMKTQDEKYNYCTGSTPGLTTTSDTEIAASHALSITFKSSADIVIKAHSYPFQYKNSSFRFYTSGSGSAVYLYKKVEEQAVYSLGKSHPVTITTAKFATYCSDEGLDFSATGVTVYKAKVSDGVVRLTEIEGGIVPPGVGVLLYKDVDVAEIVNVPVKKTSNTIEDNELVGLIAKTAVPWTSDGKYNYILQKDGQGQAKFFKATGANLIANRAYLHTAYEAAATAHALEIDVNNNQATAIKQIERSDANVGNCYNLNGQRIARPQKGINVVNGHKVVVR